MHSARGRSPITLVARQEEIDEPPRKERPIGGRLPAVRRPDSPHRAGRWQRARAAQQGPEPAPAELAPAGPAAGVAGRGTSGRRCGAPRRRRRRPPPASRPMSRSCDSRVRGGRRSRSSDPTPTPVPQGDGGGLLTVGLKRGVGYRLRIANLPERPGVELFPVIEVVGHLHRPEGIDPGKYPIRVIFTFEDLDTVINQSRLVTKVIYLEDPDQALPFRMPKDQIPMVSLNPAENPLRVAAALGRPMAIVRLGGRRPTLEEVQGGPGDFGLDYAARLGGTPCPFLMQDGSRCPMVAGPPCTAAKTPPQPLLPRDEFLCDGGDRGAPIQIGSDGRMGGVEPRDAAVRFDIGLGDRSQPRTLPTNVVCIYAPRYAEVRVTTGSNAGGRRPAHPDRRPLRIDEDGQHQGRIPEAGAEPGRRAGPCPFAGLGLQGAVVPRRGVEQPRRRRIYESRSGLVERAEAVGRDRPQPPECQDGLGEGPAPGDQDRRGAGGHGDHRGRQRGGARSGART